MKKAAWIIGSLGVTGLILWGSRAKAAPVTVTLPATGTQVVLPSRTLTIVDHDSVYDYKWDGGRWYTRKKIYASGGSWIDMKNALSEGNYNTAVQRLIDHLQANGTI